MSIRLDYVQRELTNLSYPNVNNSAKQVMDLLTNFPSLTPKTADLCDEDTKYTSVKLLSLSGTIPINYKNQSYYIPIQLYLPKLFPSWPPTIYIRPTDTMSIRSSSHVNDSGRVYDEYISRWAANRGQENQNISTLIRRLITAFSKVPPVMAKQNKPVTNTVTNNTSTYPSTSYNAYQTGYPSNQVNYPTNQQSSYPVNQPNFNTQVNYTTTQTPFQPRPVYPPNTHYNPTNAYPGYPNTNSIPVAGNSSYRPEVSDRPNVQVEQLQRQDSGTLVKNAERQSLIFQANNVLSGNGELIRTNLQNDVNNFEATFNKLSDNERTIDQSTKLLTDDIAKLTDAISQLEPEVVKKRNEVAELTNHSEFDPDEIIQPSTPLEKQIVDCYCKDLAIKDVLYDINKLLSNKSITTEQFLTETRKIGRDQFIVRAKIKKARNVGGLTVV